MIKINWGQEWPVQGIPSTAGDSALTAVKDWVGADWRQPPIRRRSLWTVAATLTLLVMYYGLLMPSPPPRAVAPWSGTPTYEVVMSYYDENLDNANETMSYISQSIPAHADLRRTVYVKGPLDVAKRTALDGISDQVIQLENVGREGETYLNHIIHNYHSGLADYTIFVQPHLAWDFIFKPRLDIMGSISNLGFMSFGPYVTQTCGKDSADNEFPRMADIYSMFRMDFCPPHPVLAVWAGQFVVSRRRILDNSLLQYENLMSKFHAPPEHWIWKEGWGNNELSNPTLGHATERTWTVIFNCTDANMAHTCPESGPQCACLD